ncbi:putative transcription factor GRAS family [Rosa chinensis]|uniref:Putative transcription factor GRAS family n=1 Tax=Rosa chinensis TaxID=74649 RepID=A0A2P6QIZ7_ROSCH|nr:putative transcription factor GRAS family [Rosa chinensis]
MDPRFSEFPSFNDQTLLPDMLSEYPSSDPSQDLSFLDPNPSNSSSSFSPEGDDSEFSDSVLKYINQVLIKEEMQSKPCMFHDPLALQATEESLHEIIGGGKNPTSQHLNPLCVDQNVYGNGNGNGMLGSYRSELIVPDMLSKSELLLQFNLGAEEGSKFLPRGQLISAEGNKPYAVADRKAGDVVVPTQKNGSEHFRVGSRGKKNHQREDIDLEDGRSNKQSAVYMDGEEGELSHIFDKVLLSKPIKSKDDQVSQNGANNSPQQDGLSVGIGNGKVCGKNQGNKKEVIDLRALLISSADSLKFYQAYIAVCPFMKLLMIFANDMILKAAEKAETLHIIDFGIRYGFQWPALIHCLSRRPGGPPKLRITGLEFPSSGFRPEEGVQETGHRLAKYCRRFNVPFEYYGIAKKWETLQFDDLRVQRNEVLAVNCLNRFKYLLDETVVVNSPRDTVLNLIRNLNPDVFVQSVVNGSHHAPFFVPRFREALFHFSALFDMLDTNLPREDQMRLGFEKEFIGREVVNIVACEGFQRIVRPETYKQWQIRNMRAGFRQLPLDREVMNKIKDKVKMGYHPSFVVDEDGHWMLHEWKGRILYASACWAHSRT